MMGVKERVLVVNEYLFSVIIAVYNTEDYLDKAVQSVVNQTIGFEKIQVILIDDGSTDNSPALCDAWKDRYPENIVVIHKENGGVASARNVGLCFARGRFYNFLDSDDEWSSNAFEEANAFFENNKETEVVAFRINFFDGKKGNQGLNWKFSGQSRSIDLRKNPEYSQLSCSSAFFRCDAWEETRFDERLGYAEDAKAVAYILMRTFRLGVSNKGRYYYRKRLGNNKSAMQKSVISENWYLPKIKWFDEDILSLVDPLTGKTPVFIQYIAMYDLQWQIKTDDLSKILDKEEEKEYRASVARCLGRIDDAIKNI